MKKLENAGSKPFYKIFFNEIESLSRLLIVGIFDKQHGIPLT